ncbi:MAG: hypothetical protein LBV38_05355 [Alistipes sp.]|jgi:putative ABC transport system permease protein|nr:hypothetical protein [Alistipes sp.]
MKFFRSNLKLLTTRFRAVTFLNFVGLSVAFAVVAVVAIQARYDFTFDRGYEHAGRIFIMELTAAENPEQGVWTTMNQQTPQAMLDGIPEIEAYAQMKPIDRRPFRIEGAGEESPKIELETTEVSTGFLEVFSPTIVAGDAVRALAEPGHGMISRRNAEIIFGTEDPIGQTLDMPGFGYSFTIDAVYEDFPKNASAPNGVLTHMTPNSRNNYNYVTYFRFDPAALDDVLEKAHSLETGEGDDRSLMREEWMRYHLTELGDFHLHGGAESTGKFSNTLYMVVMGVLIIAIAFINFVNLFMSMAPARVRKINTFRILGSDRGSLRLQLALESVVIMLASAAAGVMLVEWFSTTVFTEFFAADISPELNVPLLATLASGLMVAAFVMALYPARYATSFDVAIALKGSMVLAPRGVMLRGALIVVQFAVAIFFICFSIFIRVQYDYMSGYSVGYQKENIVIVPQLFDSLARVTFAEELKRNPDVVDISWSGQPGYLGTRWGREFEGIETMVSLWPTDYNGLRFFGVEIVAGDDFSSQMTGTEQVIVNQKFLDTYGFTAEQVLGKPFQTYRDAVIVGVAADVNFQSLHNEVIPMVFVTMPNDWAIQGLVKIAGNDTAATLKLIEETWNRHKRAQQDFSLQFLDEQLDAQYRTELNMSRLMGVLGLIAVVTAVMGVYVIILFNSRYRVREIAIRKVNGATIGEIALKLNRGLLWSLGVAMALVLAPTLWFIRSWVSDFAFRAPVPWWLFPLAGLMVLLVAAVTVSWQSWKAATANPVNALKAE